MFQNIISAIICKFTYYSLRTYNDSSFWISDYKKLLKLELFPDLLTLHMMVARFGTVCTIQKTWKPCQFTKGNTLPRVFFKVLNCANGTKSRKTSQYSSKTLERLWCYRKINLLKFRKRRDQDKRKKLFIPIILKKRNGME